MLIAIESEGTEVMADKIDNRVNLNRESKIVNPENCLKFD